MAQNRDLSSLEDNFEKRFRVAMDEHNTKFSPQIFVVEAGRDLATQRQYVKTGKSKTMNSNHLNGKAVDIAFRGAELYPSVQAPRDNLCMIMRKYGIVNGYFDLKRGFDKPHFQAVEVQKPVQSNPGYTAALNWKAGIQKEIELNGKNRHISKDQKEKDRLHDRNNILRSLLS